MSDRSNEPRPPAPPTPEEIRAYLDFQLEGMIRDRDTKIIPALQNMLAKHPTIPDGDEEVAAMFVDNIRIARALAGANSSASTTNFRQFKRPWIDGGKAVDGWFQAFDASVTKALAPVSQVLQDYEDRKEAEARRKREEAARIAQEDAERKRKEADAAKAFSAEQDIKLEQAAQLDAAAKQATQEAQARPSQVSAPSRGMYGGTASIRQTWKWRVTNFAIVPDQYKTIDEARVRDAGRKRDVNGRPVTTIPGIEWYAERNLNVR